MHVGVYLVMLKEIFAERKKKDPKYSLRTFAKQLHVSPSNLSEILNGKKNLSDKMAKSMAFDLGFKGREKDVFLTSALEYRTRNPSLKNQHHTSLKRILNKKPHLLEKNEMETVNSWVYFALLELMTFHDFDHTSLWLSRKLMMDLRNIESHLQALVTLGWVEKNKDRYQIKVQSAESANDFPSAAIRQYHQSVLKQAMVTLEVQPVDKREYQSAVLGFSRKNTQKAKRSIREFFDQFCLEFGNAEDVERDEVCQLAIQFYPLTSDKG